MAVTAKFKVTRVTPFGCTPEQFQHGLDTGEWPEGWYGAEVEMTPDYAQGRNKDWSAATPAGVFRMTITNPSALAELRDGTAQDIVLTPNPN